VSEQPLEVAMDPRVQVTQQELASLLDFQQQVGSALRRAVAAAGAAHSTESGAWKPARPGSAAAVAGVLTALAIDLEHSDAPPTEPQRELLRLQLTLLEQLEASGGPQ
jgi:hypothetical protein